MDLQNHPGAESTLTEPRCHANHRKFYYIGRCPLDGRIHRISLCQCADSGVARVDVRKVSAPAEKRFHISVLPRKGDGRIYETADGRERREIVLDKALCGAAGQSQPLRQPERRNPVHYPEVGGFGLASLLTRDFLHGNPEDLCGGGGVDVLALAESLAEVLVGAQVSHDPQFNLGIVGRYYHSVRSPRNKRFTYLLAALRANRDVLEVWVGT